MRLRSASKRDRSKNDRDLVQGKRTPRIGTFACSRVASAFLSWLTSTDLTPLNLRELTLTVPSSLQAALSAAAKKRAGRRRRMLASHHAYLLPDLLADVDDEGGAAIEPARFLARVVVLRPFLTVADGAQTV